MGGDATALDDTAQAYFFQTHRAIIDGTVAGTPLTDAYTGNPLLNIAAVTEAAWLAGSPYSGVVPYDPSDDLDLLTDQVEKYNTLLDDTDIAAQFSAALANIEAETGTAFGDVAGRITARTANYESESAPAFQRSVNRTTAAFWDMNALEGPGLLMSILALERGRQSDARAYKQRLEEINEGGRVTFISQSVSELLTFHKFMIEAQRSAALLEDEYVKLSITAQKEYIQDDLNYAYQDAVWDLSLVQQIGDILGIAKGSLTQKKDGPGRVGTAILSAASAGLSGASTGMAVGGPITAAVLGIGSALLTGIGSAL
jgi:hypothetical protein